MFDNVYKNMNLNFSVVVSMSISQSQHNSLMKAKNISLKGEFNDLFKD